MTFDNQKPLLGMLHGYGALRIYEDASLINTEVVPFEMPMSLHERFIVPLLHPVTVPFEPWRKTRPCTKVVTTPSRKIINTPFGMIMHPALAQELRVYLQKQTGDMKSAFQKGPMPFM